MLLPFLDLFGVILPLIRILQSKTRPPNPPNHVGDTNQPPTIRILLDRNVAVHQGAAPEHTAGKLFGYEVIKLHRSVSLSC